MIEARWLLVPGWSRDAHFHLDNAFARVVKEDFSYFQRNNSQAKREAGSLL